MFTIKSLQINKHFYTLGCHLNALRSDPKFLFDIPKSKDSKQLAYEKIMTGISFNNQKYEPKYHQVHVQATRNNTIACLTTHSGNIILTSTAGMCGLRKANRGTSDAGYMAVLELTKRATEKNIIPKEGIHLKVKGFGPGREQGFRALLASGWEIKRITDVTPYRHAGCRPPKKRRI